MSVPRRSRAPRPCRIRWRAALAGSVLAWCVPSCGPRQAPGPPPSLAQKVEEAKEKAKPRVDTLGDAIPSSQLDAAWRAHLEGLGHMERYEYAEAVRSFREAHERAPGWIPGSINLAIALLNQTGSDAEQAPQGRPAGGGTRAGNFDEALGLLDDVVRRDPNNLHARYSRGIILEHLGRLAEAHADFAFVAERDPTDGHAWYKVGSTLTDPADPHRPAGPPQAQELIALYSRALERNPYLVNALYKLQSAYAWAGRRDKQEELIRLWDRLNPKRNAAASGELLETFYGDMGRYARIISPAAAARPATEPEPAPPPRFEAPAPLRVALPEGHRWVRGSDFAGPLAVVGRARALVGAAVAAFDADGDGRTDLYLASAVRGPRGVRDALLINRGDGRFEDATRAAGLPDDQASLGVAAGDFDADRRIDVFVTGVGRNRLWRNLGARKFADVTRDAGLDGPPALSLTARWLDLDQDGDLDLYVINHTGAEHASAAFAGGPPPPGLANSAYRNDGKPAPIPGRPPDNWAPLAVAPEDLPATAGLSLAFTPWPDADVLLGGQAAHTGIALLDLDDDRDFDLVLAAAGQAPRAVLNDRLGRFHAVELSGFARQDEVQGLLATDLDKDGRADLVGIGATGRVLPWRNTTGRARAQGALTGEPWPADARACRGALAADLDLDTWPDLLGLPAPGDPATLSWARNDGRRLATRPLTLGPGSGNPVGFAYADLVGDPLPDLLLIEDGEPPRLGRNLGNGRHWLAVDLGGRWKASFDHMRTNPHGLGVRLLVEGQGLNAPWEHTTPASGPAQSVGPVVIGLDKAPSAALLRLTWPDGTMQCELNVAADQKLSLAEHNRKTGSCPVLFTWDGSRFVCIGDFLGGGGLGYLVAPGVYSQPDRDESVAIHADQLRPEGGVFRLSVTEPMDEVAYLDQLVLEVVDAPPGVATAPDERFAPEGPRPTGEVIAWREAIAPARATDLAGRDVTDRLRAHDRRTVDGFARLHGWIGYAEEHGIVLDFGDRLARYGPSDPLVLGLSGWVEYPYSQTNYAAATAGVVLRPPAVERLEADGTWSVIEPHAGYPAGLPRLTTLDLTGKLTGARCTIRLRTNMECYWDHAFIALRDRAAPVRCARLPVSRAELGYRGYSREVSPDGRQPLLYDYDHVDPAPLARLTGRLTRYGDVAALLRGDDDRLCVLGPGDEVRLEFDASRAPPLPSGWTRSFILRAVGYCKDADPFTATSDTVGPLPWRAMPAFPFGAAARRPADPVFEAYEHAYQTRPAGDR